MEKGRSRPLSFKFRNSQITPDLKVMYFKSNNFKFRNN